VRREVAGGFAAGYDSWGIGGPIDNMPPSAAPPPPPPLVARVTSGRRIAGAGRPRREAARSATPGDVVLCLSITRDGIGLELARVAPLGCLRITELAIAYPGMRFPADVSGGVARFRHRRGELRRLGLELDSRSLARWAAPRLRGLVSEREPDVWVAAESSKATVCVSSIAGADEETAARTAPAVAFDVFAIADGDDLVLVVANARGIDLPGPAIAIAVACVATTVGRAASRSGAIFRFRRFAAALCVALLPEAGARLPSGLGVPCTVLAADHDSWLVHAARDVPPALPIDAAIRAREAATVLCDADDALMAGHTHEARSAYLEALERAPRHPEIANRVVDIDARTPGRAEAALSILDEVSRAGLSVSGMTRGILLWEVKDVVGALASLEMAANSEPSPALASRAYELAASWTRDPADAAQHLDRALARAPRATSARWSRVGARVALGRPGEALADVEHLEALAGSPRAKHNVWMRAARQWQASGLGPRAGALFERALRYAPDEPEALAGLAAALLDEGGAARSVALLTRALAIAHGQGSPSSTIEMALGRALAERLDDLPSAIAHVSAISADAPEAALARALEARWRARLGDDVGASLAFARLREMGASNAGHAEEPDSPRTPETPDESGASFGSLEALVGSDPSDDSDPVDVESAARVDDLTRRLQADPMNDAVAEELSSLLEALGRGHELLALLSARLEDATPERRSGLAARLRATLDRLALLAQAAGRADEAALYRSARDAVG
jgi:tetratricopeptide (TPR) repeat protein